MLYSDLLKIVDGNIKPKVVVTNDREIMPYEIENEVFFPLSKEYKLDNSICRGLKVDDNGNIKYIYKELNRIFFGNDTNIIDPSKKEIQLMPQAEFNVYYNSLGSMHNLMYTANQNINGTISIDNANFSYDKDTKKLYLKNQNVYGQEQQVHVSLTYFFECRRYSITQAFILPKIEIGEWELESEHIEKIYFSNKYSIRVPNSGGNGNLKVTGKVLRTYVKKDNFGNIVEKKENRNEEDVTDKCSFYIQSSSSGFSLIGNTVYVSPQDYNASVRTCIIGAKIGDKNTLDEITQEKGKELVFNRNISFQDKSVYKSFTAESKETFYEIGFIAQEKTYIDDKEIKTESIPITYINNHNEWIKVECKDNIIHICVEQNHSKERSGNIIIGIDSKKHISIEIKQKECGIDHYEYTIDAEQIDDIVLFTPKKEIHYEDGTIKEIPLLGTEILNVNYNYDNSFKDCVEDVVLIPMNTYSYKPEYSLKTNVNGFKLNVWATIINSNGIEVARSNDCLFEMPEKNIIKSHLIVKLVYEGILEDFYLNEKPILSIDDVGKFEMQKGWVYKGQGSDVILDYDLELEKDMIYTYNIENLLMRNKNDIIDVDYVVLSGIFKGTEEIEIELKC